MYDDAWFATVPPAQSRPEPPRHKRRISLLKQPNEDDQADAGASDEPLPPTVEAEEDDYPPTASVATRAKSYTDFHHAIRAIERDQRTAQEARKKHLRLSRRASQNLEQPSSNEELDEDVSHALLDTSHEKYQLYHDQLQVSRRHLDNLLADTDANLDLLTSLSKSFENVEAQASAFQARCESLLADQRRLSTLAEDVSHNLQYYNYLDPITRRLNAPGVRHFVRSDDFSDMLAQLDDCLEYMKLNPKQREASTYGSRYRLLLTRGLTLIRVHFTTVLRETAADVSQRIADKQLNDTTMDALLYGKFRINAADLKRLALEIQQRVVPDSSDSSNPQGEYQSLVNELHQSYGAARGRLIIPLVRRQMDDISVSPSSTKDIVTFARNSIGYMRDICTEEHKLWHEWFEGEDGLYPFLETVCEVLYDYLRPRTIREPQLPKLCELCTYIQAKYMDEPDEESDTGDGEQLDFSTLVQPALEDAQTRLVFLALSVLRDDIERFKPKPDDLNYPARNKNVPLSGSKSKGPALSGRKESLQPPQTPISETTKPSGMENGDTEDLAWQYDSKESFQGWYPTLQKAIWLLSKIYRLVHSTVFDDLAHEIVHQTTGSLVNASHQIAAKASSADGQLFLLKQLLILKQQIVAFDIEFVTPEVGVDFSSVTNTFWELRERGGLFNPGNLVRLVGNSLMPRVVENMLDAKAELDAQLRNAIGDFTNGFATRMTAQVSEAATAKSDFDGAKAMGLLRKNMEKEVKVLRGKLDEYIEDARTKDTLAGAIQDQSVSNYEDFYERHLSSKQSNGAVSSKKGKGRQEGIWDPDTFADWSTTVFGLGTSDEGRSRSGSSI